MKLELSKFNLNGKTYKFDFYKSNEDLTIKENVN